MPQRKFQDIITSSDSNNPVSKTGSVRTEEVPSQKNETKEKKHPLFLKKTKNTSNTPPKKSKAVWVAVVVALIVLFIAFSNFFEKTTLKIVPKNVVMVIDTSFVAYPRDNVSKESSQSLAFDVITIDYTESMVIPATEVRKVDRRAFGKIVVFNDFNGKNQRLIKNTRFETPEGLWYRVQESITVPGQTKNKRGETIPGSIEVTVYAYEAGEKYNIGLTDFVVPGFENTPRFNAFYARSKTEMAGGFSGTVKTVSQEKLLKVRGELREQVREKLLIQVASQVPENFTLYPDAIFIVFDDEAPVEETNTDKDTATITARGVLYGFMFENSNISNFVAQELIEPKEDDAISIINLDKLSFSIEDKGALDPEYVDMFSFSYSGNPRFVWEFDEEELLSKIRTRPKSEIKLVLAQFPSITRAEVKVRPFWKQYFPKDVKNIVIKKSIKKTP